MFKLILKDSKEVPFKEGDIVKVINRLGSPVFYCEVTFLEDKKAIAPFHSFCFHYIEKVDGVPEGTMPIKEERYKTYRIGKVGEDDFEENYAEKYLMDIRNSIKPKI